LDANLRSQVLLAAVAAAGSDPDDTVPWDEKVMAAALRITVMLDETSAVSMAVENVSECERPFVAVPVAAELEPTSNRRIITFETTDRETGEVKTETLRTERADSVLGRIVYAQVKANKGRKVLVYKQVEAPPGKKTKDGAPLKVRVLRWVEPI